jgi:NCS1 family nucleobase:cation symporter-1
MSDTSDVIEQVEKESLAALDPSGRLYNEDLAPSRPDARRWGTYSIFAFWANTAHNLGAYTFAAGLFAIGLNAWEVPLGILGGAIIVFLGCLLSGGMGQATGVPFPVISRMSWGVFGANIPALIRGLAAIAWYGIQTYLAAAGLNAIFLRFIPSMSLLSHHAFLGLDAVSWLSFLILWSIQLLILSKGMEIVRHAQDWSGVVIWGVVFFLAIYLVIKSHGQLPLMSGGRPLSVGQQVYYTFAAGGLLFGILGTLMLNYADFTRFAPSRRAVISGSFWGVPVNWILFALTSVMISAATLSVYGRAILNPADVFERLDNDILLLIGASMLVFAAVGVNIVANFVSPAFDLANVWPRHISFRRGGIITALIALASLPWMLYSTPVVINVFLGGLGAMMGPLFGIMIVDYYIIKRKRVKIKDLYMPDERSDYYYRRGINPRAVLAFSVAAFLAIMTALLPALRSAAPFAWFVGTGAAALLYFFLERRADASYATEERVQNAQNR